MIEYKWRYLGKPINKEFLEKSKDYIGFTYAIVTFTGKNPLLSPDTKYYYGKKQFKFKKKSRLSKKARIGTRKKIKIEQVDSDWITYMGSCAPLKKWLLDTPGAKYKKYILHLCKTKSELSFRETELLFKSNIMCRKNCWNDHIGMYFKNKLNLQAT